LFTIKENLVVMNNLYHKLAVASVCTALGLTLVANKEAKAAVFTMTPTISYTVGDTQAQDGVGDYIFGSESLPVGIIKGEGYRQEYRAFYEFNLANLSLAPNQAIISAIWGVKANSVSSYDRWSRLDAYGYTGNGQADVSDFGAGERLDGRYWYSILLNTTIPGINPSPNFAFNVLPFISQRINNNDTFAGFSLRNFDDDAYATFNQDARLTIITADITPDVAEPVPEPTTILSAAIALGWGGWLKRNNSKQQNKTKSQD
jgi:hypothetical protein